MRFCTAVIAAFFLFCAPLSAEMSGDDYQTGEDALTPSERAAARARLADQIAAERARAEEAARRAQEEAERRAAERAARPPGERLVEARCLGCHDTAQLRNVEFGRLGWTVTVMRMELLNGAELQRDERSEIARHLAARTPGRSGLEWALAVGVLVLAAAALALGLRRLRARPS